MSVHGVFVVDKQPGLTSFDVVARVRRAARERRVGHAGTLDPMATGVLVVCLGEATKLVPYLMDAEKEYRATARLGVSTDTDDAAPGSKVLETASPEALQGLRPEAVHAALAALIGEVVQRPPRFCALKVDGERLYDRARRDLDAAGEAALEAELVAKQRTIRVDAITVENLSLVGPAPEVTFTVRCGKGTYIRALARDLGDRLGVGAHLTALRRLRVGPFSVAEACSIDDIARGTVIPHDMVAALGHLPRLVVGAELALRLRQGHRPTLNELATSHPPVLVSAAITAPTPATLAIDEAGQLVAILESEPTPDGARWIIGRGFMPPTLPAAVKSPAAVPSDSSAAADFKI